MAIRAEMCLATTYHLLPTTHNPALSACVLWRIVYLAGERIYLPIHEKEPHEFIAAEDVFIDAGH